MSEGGVTKEGCDISTSDVFSLAGDNRSVMRRGRDEKGVCYSTASTRLSQDCDKGCDNKGV